MKTTSNQHFTDIANKGYPFKQCRKTNIQPHISVENVTKLMGDNPLQLIAIKILDGATGNTDHCVGGRNASGKCIDTAFTGQQVYRRHW